MTISPRDLQIEWRGVDYAVRGLYFDPGHSGTPPALDALKDIVPISQILYGSDVPSRDYPLTDLGLDD